MLIKLSTWPCLEIRTRDKFTVWRWIIVRLKGWKSSNVWEQRWHQNSIQEEIKSRLKLGNACYYSVLNLLSSSLLSKTLKIKIYRNIIVPVVLYGCETWSLILREERRLRVFENSVLSRVFGPKRDEVTGEWRKLHIVELRDFTPYPIMCGC